MVFALELWRSVRISCWMVGIDGRVAAGDPTWFDNPSLYRVAFPVPFRSG
ncbi:hypothetical protein SynA1825c_00391 [Synechococcus sp. A18-25c]|nr:hypothetical protein SynA1825c_00391 [Synechococcus sp. A18-25c]